MDIKKEILTLLDGSVWVNARVRGGNKAEKNIIAHDVWNLTIEASPWKEYEYTIHAQAEFYVAMDEQLEVVDLLAFVRAGDKPIDIVFDLCCGEPIGNELLGLPVPKRLG
jgi:hypothetical protein